MKQLSIVLLFFISMIFQVANASQLDASERNTVTIFQRSAPLVVNVHRILKVADSSHRYKEVATNLGSGIIWNKQGYIVTNYHVIQDASRIEVTLSEGKTVAAKLVGAEPRKDIAVLKIKPPRDLNSLTPLQLADSSKLLVGQKTIAIGNPFGLTRTLTTGVISALGRQIQGVAGTNIHDMIQTDASINPGNSGGPLLNSQGQLIGMNTIIFSKSGSSHGIGFAVPSNDIKQTVQQLIKYGHVVQPGIGVELFSDRIAKRLNIKGVIINKVLNNSPAAKAGLRGTLWKGNSQVRLGDIIVAVNGKPVYDYDDLYYLFDDLPVGEKIKLSYLRDGKTYQAVMKTVDLAR